MRRIMRTPVIFLILLGALSLGGFGKETVIQLRLYEGLRETMPSATEVISAYHLNQAPKNLDAANIPIDQERNSLKRIFNLEEVDLIAYGNLSIGPEKEQKDSQFFVHDKRDFTVQLTASLKNSDQFQVRVTESKKMAEPLLETKIIIPFNKTAVIGFEDSDKKIYFISFFRVSGAVSSRTKAGKLYKKPELLIKVNPRYPEEAKDKGIQGMEILQAQIDDQGNIRGLEPILTAHPLLNHSAMVAIKQWKYTPGMIAGQPTRIPLTVMVNFILKEGSQLMVPGKVDFHIESVRLRFLNKVAPTYPPEALKKNIQGKVVMMAFVNKKGSVCHVKAFKGNPILAKAAETAMNQWRFKPYIIKGKRQSILFAVTFTFNITRKSK